MALTFPWTTRPHAQESPLPQKRSLVYEALIMWGFRKPQDYPKLDMRSKIAVGFVVGLAVGGGALLLLTGGPLVGGVTLLMLFGMLAILGTGGGALFSRNRAVQTPVFAHGQQNATPPSLNPALKN